MCSLANKLKYLREKKGLTKKDVAEAVGVHPSSIGNLEKGSIPQADLLYSLAKFFLLIHNPSPRLSILHLRYLHQN